MITPDASAQLAVYASENDIDLGPYVEAVEQFQDHPRFFDIKDIFATAVLAALQRGTSLDDAMAQARPALDEFDSDED